MATAGKKKHFTQCAPATGLFYYSRLSQNGLNDATGTAVFYCIKHSGGAAFIKLKTL